MDLVCEECGETNRAGTEFCVFCGHFLAWGADSGTAPSQPVLPPPPPPRPTGPPADAPDWRPPGPTATVTHDASRPTQELPTYAPSTGPVPSVPANAPALALQQNCPRCGRANDASRRFCAKCGHQLIAAPGRPLARAASTSRVRRWWERLWDTKDRAARRAYRRSLPPLLRWRRVLLSGVLALVLVGGSAVVFRQGPDDLARAAVDQWYELRNGERYVNVREVRAELVPPTPGQDPSRLVDNSRDAWTTSWPGTDGGGPCTSPAGVPAIRLDFPATRIKRIDVRAGLSDKLSDSKEQYRPRRLGVRFDGEEKCSGLDLGNVFDNSNLPLDSRRRVSSMTIYVETAFRPAVDVPQERLSITEINLDAHPRRVF